MTFRSAPPALPLNVEGINVEWVSTHQYLGVWIDARLTFGPQITYLRQRLGTRLAVLRCIGGLKGGSSYKVRCLFYTHDVRSLLDHCGVCLVTLNETKVTKLEVKPNYALRLIVGAPPRTKVVNLREETNLPAISHRALQRTASLVAKMAHSPKQYIAPQKALEAADRDRMLFATTSWAAAAGEALRKTGILETVHRKGKNLPHPAFS